VGFRPDPVKTHARPDLWPDTERDTGGIHGFPASSLFLSLSLSPADVRGARSLFLSLFLCHRPDPSSDRLFIYLFFILKSVNSSFNIKKGLNTFLVLEFWKLYFLITEFQFASQMIP
jgi:hypothetical protein